MATATKTKPKAQAPDTDTDTDAPVKAKKARPSAVIDIDLNDTIDEARLDEPATRRSQWDGKLDEVYTLTEDGSIPRNEDGSLRFVKIGQYTSSQGAKAQVKAFHKKGLNSTYEFRVGGSDLYVRVVETN